MSSNAPTCPCSRSLAFAAVCREAPAAPESSLQRCQRTVQKSSVKFVAKALKAFGTCLTKVSQEIVQDGAPNAADAAEACAALLGKVAPTEQKMIADITAKCDPAEGVEHTLGDLRGVGAGVAEPLDTRNLDVWCAAYGGDGVLDTAGEWIDCIRAANDCASTRRSPRSSARSNGWIWSARDRRLVPDADGCARHAGCRQCRHRRSDRRRPGPHLVRRATPATGQLTSYLRQERRRRPPVAARRRHRPRRRAAPRYADNGDGTITDSIPASCGRRRATTADCTTTTAPTHGPRRPARRTRCGIGSRT
jgi:hypothetical protein